MIDEKNTEVYTEDEDLIDLVDDNGRHLKFFHVGSTEYLKKWYAFFMPAEEIEGLAEEEVVIFEVSKDDKGDEILLPVEDSALLENVYEQFCREMEDEADAAEAEELDGGCCCGHHHGDHEECECHGEHHHEHGEGCCHGEHHHEHGEGCRHGEHHHEHSEGCCHGEHHHEHGEGCRHGEGKKENCKKHKK